MTTGLLLDTLSMQFQKDIGPSTKLGPIRNNEGYNKNNYPIKAQSSKGSPNFEIQFFLFYFLAQRTTLSEKQHAKRLVQIRKPATLTKPHSWSA